MCQILFQANSSSQNRRQIYLPLSTFDQRQRNHHEPDRRPPSQHVCRRVDADLAGSWHKEFSHLRNSVLSHTRFLITYCGCPVTWSSKLQSEITLSTTEAESITRSMATRQLIPLCRIMEEISQLGPVNVTLDKKQPIKAFTRSLQSHISSTYHPLLFMKTMQHASF